MKVNELIESYHKQEKTESKCSKCGKTKAKGHHWSNDKTSYVCNSTGETFSRKSSLND